MLSSKTRVFGCFILGGFFVGGFYFVVGFLFVCLFVFPQGACGIIVPGPGIEPGPWAVKAQNLNHSITREFHKKLFLTSKMLGRISLVATW